MSKSKCTEKTQLTLNCTGSYHPFPPHCKMNFVHVFVTNNKRYSIDMNVAVPFSTFKLWHLKAVPLELKVKEKLYHMLHSGKKKTLFMESNYFPGFCHWSCLLSSVIC